MCFLLFSPLTVQIKKQFFYLKTNYFLFYYSGFFQWKKICLLFFLLFFNPFIVQIKKQFFYLKINYFFFIILTFLRPKFFFDLTKFSFFFSPIKEINNFFFRWQKGTTFLWFFKKKGVHNFCVLPIPFFYFCLLCQKIALFWVTCTSTGFFFKFFQNFFLKLLSFFKVFFSIFLKFLKCFFILFFLKLVCIFFCVILKLKLYFILQI